MIRSFHHRDFATAHLVQAKRGRLVSVCLPARDEAATVGAVVETIRIELMERHSLVDELVVIDDGSSDDTAAVATAAGADVLSASGILPEYGTENGKGQALWRGVHVTSGDLVVFCDTDVRNFGAHFVTGLVGPLLLRDDVTFVKGFYRRPFQGRPDEGGRVTELVARPLISSLFPRLAPLMQPLAGECAARREVLERVPFVDGYGVDLGLLIDISDLYGAGSLVQCDLGERIHRNRPLAELAPQAAAIVQLVLSRAGALPAAEVVSLLRPGAAPVIVATGERPPLMDVPAHRKSA